MNKLKIMRKIVKRENRNLDFASEDMSMWGAPGECWNIIEKSYAKLFSIHIPDLHRNSYSGSHSFASNI